MNAATLRSVVLTPLAALALVASAAGAPSADPIVGSRLALRSVRVASPSRLAAQARPSPGDELLAQRAITREWGPSEDTTYVVVEVHDYRSEGWAMLFSAAVPGTGEFYVGEASGWLFLAAEAAGWTSRALFRKDGRDRRDEAQRYAGPPGAPSSNWSFSRWNAATHGDTLALQQLYAGDREAFYHLIGFDPRYKDGWVSAPFDAVRDFYQVTEKKYQRAYKRARYATGGIILVHIVSALDALRAAREHNLPLDRNLRLKLRGSIDQDGGSMAVALERRF